MKTAALFSSILIAACARDSRPATAPPSTAAQQPSNVEVPDLDLDIQRVDGLPMTELVDPGAARKQPVREAIAILQPTSGNAVTGTVRFVDVDGPGVEVYGVAHGLGEGVHAYHVHVYGDCSAPDGTSAGPHFHFTGSSFDKEVDMITGNLGELRRHENDGTSTHRGRVPHASLQGEFSLIGRAVVVHEHGNDPQITPDGGAGKRLACGVIGVADPKPPQAARR